MKWYKKKKESDNVDRKKEKVWWEKEKVDNVGEKKKNTKINIKSALREV